MQENRRTVLAVSLAVLVGGLAGGLTYFLVLKPELRKHVAPIGQIVLKAIDMLARRG